MKKLHIDSFPAIHIKKMDWMDFTLKFSSELLILMLCLGVTGLNWFFLGGASAKSFQDKSLSADFLNLHPGFNPKVYAQNTSIVTVVSSNPLLPQAQADDFSGLDSQGLTASGAGVSDGSGNDIIMGDENSFLAPNPDSVQSLIAKQIKIYQTRSGDTLSSLSQQFGINAQTIAWANKLSSSTVLKPGWQLIILPTDGVLVQAGANDTLPDIAHQYNPEKYNTNSQVRENSADQLLQRIISYNALDGAEDINPGDLIIVPGGQFILPPAPPAPKPKPKSKSSPSLPDNSLNTVTSLGDGYDGINHLFPKGYCTYYVATKMKITFGGNAKSWLANARASGYVTGQEPAIRSAVVMTGPKGAMLRFGHVAYVEEVSGGQILVSEMNYDHFNRIDERWVSVNDPTIKGYIYP